MLPFAQPLTTEFAARWSALGVPRWVTKVLLTAGWGLALIAAMAGDTTRCSPDLPAICSPDQGFAWWIVICAATPVLLIWMPLVGCLAGVAFAAADIAYDDVTSANIGFGLHGLACAVVAVWLLRAATAQERAAAFAGGGFTAAVPAGHERRATGKNPVRLSTAGVLALLGVALLGWYGHQVQTEDTHLARAERVAGRVVSVDDENFSITLAAATGNGARRVTTGVQDTGPYPVGSVTPVLLDPQEVAWSRLVAEPQDPTGWESAGLGALLLALLLGLVEREKRRARQRLWSGEHPALRVWVVPDESGAALVLPDDCAGEPVDAGTPIARLPLAWGSPDWAEHAGTTYRSDVDPVQDVVHDPLDGNRFEDGEWDAATAASFGRAWRGETDPHDEGEAFHLDRVVPEPAVLLGSFRDRGWAVLVTDEDVLVPSGPLQVGHLAVNRPSWQSRLLARLPFGPWRDAAADRDGAADTVDDESFLPGVPVRATVQDLPDLPVVAVTAARTRVAGLAAIGAGLVGAPAALVLVELDWYGRAMVVFVGGSVLVGGVARALQQVRLTHAFLEVSSSWRVRQVPWERLHGARRDGATLAIAWEPDMVTEVGPFDAPAGTAGRAQRAEQLGAMMLRLRERAIVAGAKGRPTSSRPGPVWGFLAAYSALIAVACWAVINR